MFERIIHTNLLSHLKRHSLLNRSQFGFLPGKSTEIQLLHCITDWLEQLSKGKSIDVLYLDVAKAFDCVNHKLLLCKLARKGVGGAVLRWLTSYLNGRTMRVRVNDQLSAPIDCTSGVPQGSVLGPMLFLVFIDDLNDAITNSSLVLYADDAKLYNTVDSDNDREQLQQSLDNVCKWMHDNDLQLSIAKCKVLHIGNKNTRHTYNINGSALAAVDSINDLGVVINKSLNFDEHISRVVSGAGKRLAVINRSFTHKGSEFRIQMFKTFVRPLLENCTSVWSPQTPGLISDLEDIQRRFTRSLFAREHDQRPCYEDRLTSINLMSLKNRRLLADLCLCHKYVHNLIDSDTHMFNRSTRRSRANELYLISNISEPSDKRYNSFKFRTVKSFNSLPTSLRCHSKFSSFKTGCARHLFNLQCS